MTRELVLASASTARARVLDGAGIAYRRQPASVDEASIKAAQRAAGAGTAAAAVALAAAKANAIAAVNPQALVIGADQILEHDGEWFDKPPDKAAAERQLRVLRGRTHRLVSALCVAGDGRIQWHHVATARLTMRAFTDGFLARYLDSAGPEVLESVGAYRLEGAGVHLFSHIDGDYFTILGLPLLPLLAFLRRRDVVET